MSRLAPIVINQAFIKVLDHAVSLINKDSEDPFPLVSTNDPGNSFDGQYLAVEAKHILTAAMMRGKWDKLMNKFKSVGLPDPADVEAGYRISTWNQWPASTVSGGLIGHATDQQANVLADVSFTRLMYAQQPNLAAKHAKLLKKGSTGEATQGQSQATTQASQATTQASQSEDAMEIDEDPANEQETAALIKNALPAATSSQRKFRLTKNWKNWPSAGQLSFEVANGQQVRYSILSDVIFETIKVEVTALCTKRAKAVIGEKDEAADELAKDEATMELLIEFLQRWQDEPGNKVHTRAGQQNSNETAASFRNFVDERKNTYSVQYLDDYDRQRDLVKELKALAEPGLVQLFIAAGRALKAQERDENMRNKRISATPSLADTALLVISDDDDDDEEEEHNDDDDEEEKEKDDDEDDDTGGPRSKRGGARGGSRGRPRGSKAAAGGTRGGSRGSSRGGSRGRPRGSKATAGSKRGREANDESDSEDDEVEGGEVAGPSKNVGKGKGKSGKKATKKVKT